MLLREESVVSFIFRTPGQSGRQVWPKAFFAIR